MCACVQPRITPFHDLNGQLTLIQIVLIHAGDFQLTTRTGLHSLRNVHHLGIVKIQSSHRITAFRDEGLFFDAGGFACFIKRNHTITLWVGNVVGKYSCTAGLGIGTRQQLHQVMPIKNVVPQHQRARRGTDEIGPNDEGLRQTIRTGLHGITQIHAPTPAIAQELLKAGGVLRRADDEHITNPRQHQRGERVIHHRLVIDGQQLLAHSQRGRMQACA